MVSIVSIRPSGDRAALVELTTTNDVLTLHAHLDQHPLDGQVDLIAAQSTLLVTASTAAHAARFPEQLRHVDPRGEQRPESSEVMIETVYDGPDLDVVVEHAGVSVEEVISLHTSQVWTAAFTGFVPGFAYLLGEHERLRVPRRTVPRTAVPAGSVALGAAFSTVYPQQTPGGWQLIGHTSATMWDLSRSRPALVRPGDRVRFKAVRECVAVSPPAPGLTSPSGGQADLTVKSTGLQALFQDLGRSGLGDLGVTTSGALDRGALKRANDLVGNPHQTVGIEILRGGLVLEAHVDHVLAVTGALSPVTTTRPDGLRRSVEIEAPFLLRAGESVELGPPVSGLRNYLAVRGGFVVRPILGSRSTDTLSGIGPMPLEAGSDLRINARGGRRAVGRPLLAPELRSSFDVIRGPRDDWFDEDSLAAFTNGTWTVTSQSNRVGVRLAGSPLHRSRAGELPSEGMVVGAIQVPPSGLPIIFLADHPVTGGYPVIGVLAARHHDHAAQLVPGAHITFRWVQPAQL